MTPPTARSQPVGSVLVGALLVLVILQLVVATMVLSGGRDAERSKARVGQARAFYNTEAAAAMSLREIAHNADHDGDGTIGGISDDGNDSNNPVLNGGSLKAVFAAGSPATISTVADAIGSARATVISVVQPAAEQPTRPGLYFESWPLPSHTLVNNFNWGQQPTTIGWVHVPYWPNQSTANMQFAGQGNSAVRITAKITVPTAGLYTFAVDVDDDVKLLINGTTVAHRNNNGGCQRFSGTINLAAGEHDYQILFTDGGGSGCLMAFWRPPGTPSLVADSPTAFSWSPTERLPSLNVTDTISFSGGGTPATAPAAVAWNASQGAYTPLLQIANEADLATNSTANNAITGYNGSTVHGDVRVGVNGNPAAGVFFNSQASYTGTSGALARRIAVPIHGLPGGLPAASSAVSLNGNQSLTIDSNRRFPSVTLSNQSVINISGDRTVYVTGAFAMSGNTTVVIPDGSVLRLYIDGALSINNQAILNTSQQPGRCYIYMRGSNQAFSLTNTAQVHAHVRNPLGTVGFSSDAGAPSIFSGTLSARTFQASSRTQVRLDCGPLSTGGTGGGGSTSGLLITGYTDQ